MKVGAHIAQARKALGLTQEELAGKVGVSFQSISAWERDENLPDTGHLAELSRALELSLDSLFDEHIPREWELRSPNFDADRMYTYVKARAQARGLEQTLAALPFMREKHAGQYRKGRTERAPYAVHPLTLACHALAMGLEEDDVLAAMLLHDVVEDTGTRPDELPAGERVRRAVALVSYNTYPGDKASIKPAYYAAIREEPLACLIKCTDRCHNLSCMADGFTRRRMAQYVTETERYILPLLDTVKAVPAWNSAAWLLGYQMKALLETFKRLI